MPSTVDTSIYSTVKGPVETMTGINNLMLGVNQNKLFQQEFGAKKAIGQAYAANTDAAGNTNDAGVLADVAHGGASFLMPQLRQATLERQRGEIGKQKEQLELALKHGQTMSGFVSGLISLPPGQLTTERVVKQIHDGVKSKLIPAEDAAQEIAGLPTDENGLRQWAMDHLLRYEDTNQKIATVLGTPTTMDTGAGTVIGTQGPIHGFVPTGNVPRSLSPSEAASQHQVFDAASGTYRTVPLSSLASRGGGPIVSGPNPLTGSMGGGVPNALGVSPPGASMQTAPMADAGGAQPVAIPAGAPRPPVGVSAPAPASGGPGVATSPPLGQAEAASAAGARSGQALSDLQEVSQGASERIMQVTKALDALRNTKTGPGTERRNTIMSWLQAAPGVDRWLPKGWADDVKSYDEAVKYMRQYASGVAGSVGPNTDSGLATALSSNASEHISQLAAEDVLRANLALERYRQLQALSWSSANLPESEFNNWSTRWKASTDPRGLLLDQMPKAARSKMMEGASDAQDKRMESTYRMGVQNGIF